MTQTLALFLDAYRELNSKRLFWLVLILSGLVVASFACLGIDERGVTLLWYNLGDFGGFVNSNLLPPEQLYKTLFSEFGIKFWLAWLATILALVSTAGMIPDFIASGAIELTLSKPISRLRLFFTKFLMGLLFVTMQVSIFTFASFLVIGIRGHAWQPGVFLAIPLVMVFYSYLFSVCVLVGLVTRSTITSLLLTLLFWLFLFCLNATDAIILQGREVNAMRIESVSARIERMERATVTQLRKKAAGDEVARGVPEEEAARHAEALTFTTEQINENNAALPKLRRDLADARTNTPKWQFASRVAVTAKTIFPKTSETTALLERALIERMDISTPKSDEEDSTIKGFGERMSRADQQRLAARMDNVLRSRSVGWVLGTSLGFEACVLGIAGWLFVRRDF